MKTDQVTLSEADADLLATYEHGPRIWDAACFAPSLFRLLGYELIERVSYDEGSETYHPDHRGSACALTEKGRRLREGEPAAHLQAWT